MKTVDKVYIIIAVIVLGAMLIGCEQDDQSGNPLWVRDHMVREGMTNFLWGV